MPVSADLQSSMQNLGFHGNYEVVYNAVDTNLYFPMSGNDKRPFTFLHVSTFAEAKNVKGIIRAFDSFQKLNPNLEAELTIAGDGDLNALKNFAKTEFPELLNIRLLGTQPYKGVARLMQTSDCFILFSNYENLPCVIAEAHCCGLPVIATEVGGIPEMIDPSNGILIQKRDENALSRAMADILQNRDRFKSDDIHLKAKSRYGYQVIGKQFEEIYRAAIAEKQP